MGKNLNLDERICDLEKRLDKGNQKPDKAVSPNLLFRLGIAYLDKYRKENNKDSSEKNIFPDFPNIEYCSKALEKFGETLETAQKHAGAHYYVAFLAYSVGNIDMALDELKKVIEHTPAHGDAHFVLGRLYRRQGKTLEAEHHFEESKKYNLSLPFTRKKLENLLNENRKEFAGLLTHLKNELKERRFDSVLNQNIGVMYEVMHDIFGKKKSKIKSKLFLDRAKMLNPFFDKDGLFSILDLDESDQGKYKNLAVFLEEVKKYEAAGKSSEEIVKNASGGDFCGFYDFYDMWIKINALMNLEKKPPNEAKKHFFDQLNQLGECDIRKKQDCDAEKSFGRKIYDIAENRVFEIIEDCVRESEVKLHLKPHLEDTIKWIKVLINVGFLKEDISHTDKLALVIAAGLHDIDRADKGRIKKADYGFDVSEEIWKSGYGRLFGLIKAYLPVHMQFTTQKQWSSFYLFDSEERKIIFRLLYNKYKEEHSKRSAEIVHAMFAGKMPEENLRLACDLILKHETGGSELSDIVRDADSISHFWTVNENYTRERSLPATEFKIDYMYERMSEFGKSVALPFYILANYRLLNAFKQKLNEICISKNTCKAGKIAKKIHEIRVKIEKSTNSMKCNDYLCFMNLEPENERHFWNAYNSATEQLIQEEFNTEKEFKIEKQKSRRYFKGNLHFMHKIKLQTFWVAASCLDRLADAYLS